MFLALVHLSCPSRSLASAKSLCTRASKHIPQAVRSTLLPSERQTCQLLSKRSSLWGSSPANTARAHMASPRDSSLRHAASTGLSLPPQGESPGPAPRRLSGMGGVLRPTALAHIPQANGTQSIHLRQQQQPLYNLQHLQPKLLAVGAPHTRHYG